MKQKKKQRYGPPKGMRDYLPEDVYARRKVAEQILAVLRQYGYRELITPGVEDLEVLKAKAGEAIIDQIYYLRDKSGRELGLKSDITPAVARIVAGIGRSMPKPIRFAIYDRVWRYESPQSGRYREFYQINAEQFGATGAAVDAELIACLCRCYEAAGLPETRILIGHRRVLEAFVRTLGVPKEQVLNVIRVIDKRSKITSAQFAQEIEAAGLPESRLDELENFVAQTRGPVIDILERTKQLCNRYQNLMEYLEELGEMFDLLDAYHRIDQCVLDLGLARGFDYYTGIIFECEYLNRWGIGAIGGGGRYDNLVEVYGGPPIPATGFSIGFDRVMALLERLGRLDKQCLLPTPYIYIAPVDSGCVQKAIQIAESLRDRGVVLELGTASRSVAKELQNAIKVKAKFVVFVGSDEIGTDQFKLRDLETREERVLSESELVTEFEDASADSDVGQRKANS